MTKETGGPAFPFHVDFPKEPGKGTMYHDGMTLRDYFAAKAMQGLLANNNINAQKIAQAAYVVADAMLKARGE